MHRPGTVVTIGNFDGVHLGHVALVRRAREIAERAGGGVRVVALAFDPHPAATLAPERVPPRLTTFEQRARLLGEAGADEVARLEPTGELLAMTPEQFLDEVVAELRPVAVVEGADFRFGNRRAGDVGTLEAIGKSMGFALEVVPPVEVALTDGTVVRASSTVTRWLLENGRARDAAAVLGRVHEVRGVVVKGDQRGRGIGYPTANVKSDVMAPGDGVYAGWGELPGGKRMVAAISVGDKPTFAGSAKAVEAFLMKPEGGAGAVKAVKSWRPLHGLAEYGWPLRLTFEHWVREQVRFEGVPALLEQIERDCVRICEMMDDAVSTRVGKEAACR